MRHYVSFTSLDPDVLSFPACFLPNSFGKVRHGRFCFLKKSQHCASPNREGVKGLLQMFLFRDAWVAR